MDFLPGQGSQGSNQELPNIHNKPGLRFRDTEGWSDFISFLEAGIIFKSLEYQGLSPFLIFQGQEPMSAQKDRTQ